MVKQKSIRKIKIKHRIMFSYHCINIIFLFTPKLFGILNYLDLIIKMKIVYLIHRDKILDNL